MTRVRAAAAISADWTEQRTSDYADKMAQWKFQLLPNRRGIIGVGYRMDAIGQAVEDEVNDALPYRFRFHGITKIVLRLDEAPQGGRDYEEALGVAEKQIPEFSIDAYATLSDVEKRVALQNAIRDAFHWFENEFDDAGFIESARAKLGWAT